MKNNIPTINAKIKNSVFIQSQSLCNVQLDFVKLYSTNFNEHELLELKNILVHHFSQKAISEADNIWQENGMSAQIMDDWVNEKQAKD